jgi:glycyl-tRNA synthetase alpha chain
MLLRSLSFQEIIFRLQKYWGDQGCALLQPYDMEVGAGTFHPATVLGALGPDPWNVCYVQPSRRPKDGRYADNPNRVQRHHQFQVILKPSPLDVQELYLGSLQALDIDPMLHDIRFVEDDWESPTLGASGLGWECWCDGQEVTQFTYFQQIAGYECNPVSAELTYGLERLALPIQNKESFYDLDWNGATGDRAMTYGDVFRRSEREFSAYNFEYANTDVLLRHFMDAERECEVLVEAKLALPAYDQCIKASHLFNLMDSRGVVSVMERPGYIARVRNLAKACCTVYLEQL